MKKNKKLHGKFRAVFSWTKNMFVYDVSSELHFIPQKLHPVGKPIVGIRKSVTMKLRKGKTYEADNEQNFAGR